MRSGHFRLHSAYRVRLHRDARWVRPQWGRAKEALDRDELHAVFRGRRLESVTIGKMPRRQVIVYEKRLAAIEQRKLFWFMVWGIDRKDRGKSVWRVELRAGKKELKDRWRITTFEDFEVAIGDVMRHAADKVRYRDDFQTDSNVSRQNMHPLWEAVIETVDRDLFDFRAGLLPDQVREIEREQAKRTYLGVVT